MKLRFARPEDAGDILAIYAPYVRETTVTFETEVPSLEAFRRRMADFQKTYPWIVCEEEGKIAGYAYASPCGTRQAYGWSADCSVYVERGRRHSGVGTAMYRALLALLQAQNIHAAYALVSCPNPASEAFHAAMGFEVTGRYPKVGFKYGKWLDILLLRRELLPCTGVPAPVIPIGQLDRALCEKILCAE